MLMADQQAQSGPGEPEPGLVQRQVPRPRMPGGAAAQVPVTNSAATTHSPCRRPRERRGLSGSTVAREVTYRMSSKSPTHRISSKEVCSVCTLRPVAGSVFSETAVRVLRWKTAGVEFMSAVRERLEISDVWTVFFLAAKSTPQVPSD